MTETLNAVALDASRRSPRGAAIRLLAGGLWPVMVVLVCAGATGCTRAKAKASPDAPALDMPAPPPRDLETNEAEPPQPATLPQEPARNAPPRARPISPQSPPQPQRNEAPKPEPRIEPQPPVIEQPKPSEEAPRPPPTTLQTTPSQAEGEVERNIRATVTRATTDLNRIDYRVLNADARVQYDT